MRKFATLLLLVWLPAPAFSWGHDGHEIVAALAQNMLSNNVLAKVRGILRTNDLASVALWADQARQLMKDDVHPGLLRGDAEAEQFIKDHRDNDRWHFVNLPLKTFKYLYNGRFAATNDIVHTLTNCIAVLEGRSPSPSGTNTSLTKAQALRFIIHLAGDIHQPLHVGCGFYETNRANGLKLLESPSDIHDPDSHDMGANLLLFVTGHTTNKLHGYWDEDLVRKVDPSKGNKQLLQLLSDAIATSAKKWKSKGNYHEWPARWAMDSVAEARGAHDGLTFGAARFNKKGEPRQINVTLAADYPDKQVPRVTRQLAKAAYHLAELLNRIRWE